MLDSYEAARLLHLPKLDILVIHTLNDTKEALSQMTGSPKDAEGETASLAQGPLKKLCHK